MPARSATPPRPDRTAARVHAVTVLVRAHPARTSTVVVASPARVDARTTADRGRVRAVRVGRPRPGPASATARAHAPAGPVAASGWTETANREVAPIARATTAVATQVRTTARSGHRVRIRVDSARSPASASPVPSAATDPRATGRCATTRSRILERVELVADQRLRLRACESKAASSLAGGRWLIHHHAKPAQRQPKCASAFGPCHGCSRWRA